MLCIIGVTSAVYRGRPRTIEGLTSFKGGRPTWFLAGGEQRARAIRVPASGCRMPIEVGVRGGKPKRQIPSGYISFTNIDVTTGAARLLPVPTSDVAVNSAFFHVSPAPPWPTIIINPHRLRLPDALLRRNYKLTGGGVLRLPTDYGILIPEIYR